MGKRLVLFPIYINSQCTLEEGRKFSLESSVRSPARKEIAAALRKLKYIYEEDAKEHPKWTVKRALEIFRKSGKHVSIDAVERIFREQGGRFVVSTDERKRDVAAKLSAEILAARAGAAHDGAAQASEGKIENKLRLVPKKKKKGKSHRKEA